MPIHVIDADFGSYTPRRNRPVTIGRDETLGLWVRWRDGADPKDITGAFVTAWLVDAEGTELLIPTRIADAVGGIVEIIQPPFTLAAGRYTLITRITLSDVTRRARVDLTLERAIGTLVSPPVAIGSIDDVTLAGGAPAGTVDAAAVILGATKFAVTGTGASVDAAGLVTLATGAVIAGETIAVTGSNDAGSVTLSFNFTVTPSAPAVVTPGRIEIQDLGTSVRATFVAPELSGVPAPGAVLAVTIDGGVLAVTDGEAIIPKALAVQALAAVWTATNTAGEIETDPVTASVPDYDVPAAMVAPVPVVLSATAIRFPRPPAPANGGNAISSYRFYHTVNGVAQVALSDVGVEVDLTLLSPGDIVAGEFRAVNGAGEADPGATGTAQTWQLADAPLAGTLVGDELSVIYTWPALPDLKGRPLEREEYVLYDDTDAEIGGGVRTASVQTIIASEGAGRYVRSRVVTDAGDGALSPASNAVTVTDVLNYGDAAIVGTAVADPTSRHMAFLGDSRMNSALQTLISESVGQWGVSTINNEFSEAGSSCYDVRAVKAPLAAASGAKVFNLLFSTNGAYKNAEQAAAEAADPGAGIETMTELEKRQYEILGALQVLDISGAVIFLANEMPGLLGEIGTEQVKVDTHLWLNGLTAAGAGLVNAELVIVDTWTQVSDGVGPSVFTSYDERWRGDGLHPLLQGYQRAAYAFWLAYKAHFGTLVALPFDTPTHRLCDGTNLENRNRGTMPGGWNDFSAADDLVYTVTGTGADTVFTLTNGGATALEAVMRRNVTEPFTNGYILFEVDLDGISPVSHDPGPPERWLELTLDDFDHGSGATIGSVQEQELNAGSSNQKVDMGGRRRYVHWLGAPDTAARIRPSFMVPPGTAMRILRVDIFDVT